MNIMVGDYVVGRHSLRVNGHVTSVFRAEWRPNPTTGTRTLIEHPLSASRDYPALCRVQLIRPYSVHDDTRDVPPGVHPVVTDCRTGRVEVAYVPIQHVQPVPDFL